MGADAVPQEDTRIEIAAYGFAKVQQQTRRGGSHEDSLPVSSTQDAPVARFVGEKRSLTKIGNEDNFQHQFDMCVRPRLHFTHKTSTLCQLTFLNR